MSCDHTQRTDIATWTEPYWVSTLNRYVQATQQTDEMSHLQAHFFVLSVKAWLHNRDFINCVALLLIFQSGFLMHS